MKLSSSLLYFLGALAVASPSMAVPIGKVNRDVAARDSWTSFWTTEWTYTLGGGATSTAAASAATTTSTPAEQDTVYSSTIPAAAASATSVSASDVKTANLAAHNALRAKYSASDLVWNETLATGAQKWADKCHYAHSGGSLFDFQYGENIAAGTGSYSTENLIKLWSDEASAFNFAAPKYDHFSQQVWKGTQSVGCAVATCNDLDAFAEPTGSGQYLVCDYYPAGNIEGEFRFNVQGVTCDSC